MSQKIKFIALPLLLLIAIVAAYIPGLSGGFMFDDYPHIVDNDTLAIPTLTPQALWHAALSSNAGPLKRPVSMLSLAINHHYAGLTPFAYKLTNVFIHLLATIFVGMLAWLITRQTALKENTAACASIAFFSMAIWGLHPYNLTSVLYVIQRMTSLSGMFSLMALVIYAYTRPRIEQKISHAVFMIAGVTVAGALAIFSKENALLLPLQIAVLEITLFRNSPLIHPVSQRIRKLLLLGIFIAISAAFIHKGIRTDWSSAYLNRDFTLLERILTEQRILWTYIQQILVPHIPSMGLFLDDFQLSQTPFQPISTLFAIFGHIALLVIGVFARKKNPVLSFAILWFYSSHLLESTIFPLELMFEHRNYLAMLGPIYGLVFFIFQISPSEKLRRLPMLGMLTFTLILGVSTAVRASYFGNWIEYAMYEADHHPNSSRANFYAGRTLSQLMQRDPTNQKFYADKAFEYYDRAESVDRTRIEPLIGKMQTYIIMEQKVPDALMVQLGNKLRNASPGNNAYYIFKGIIDTAAIGYPSLISKRQLEFAYTSTLQNRKFRGQNLGHALISYALLKCNILDSCIEGLEYGERAVKAAPGYVEFKVILGSLYLSTGDTMRGRTWLAIAKKQDKLGYFAGTFNAIDQGAHVTFGPRKMENNRAPIQ
jgi:hypothetical protein